MPESPYRVLIVEDQPAVVQALAVLFDLHDIPYVAVSSPGEALAIARAEPLAVVVQDMNFSRSETSGTEGVKLFRALREQQPGLPVLLITAWASLETAVDLVRDGAADYLQKPWDDEKLVAMVRSLSEVRGLELASQAQRQRLAQGRAELAASHDLRGLVYESEAMHRLLGLAVDIAGSDAPVLISGPSGAGKEMIAEIVQANSGRSDGPFVRVNVGAMPEELIESELFGAEAGAFTGARQRRIGHFETAHRGTLFLDEIDSLSPAGQVKLLRVLQSGAFQRLGSSRDVKVDVRVVSATNASLEDALSEGRFREDLFFRLNVIELRVPPLSERTADILPLARHFLRRFATADPSIRGVPTLSRDAEAEMLCHPWPGNVRELENRVRRAVLVARGAVIEPRHLDLSRSRDEPRSEMSADDEVERRELLRLLSETGGVVAHAADRLGISRQALYRRMERLGVELERRPRG